MSAVQKKSLWLYASIGLSVLVHLWLLALWFLFTLPRDTKIVSTAFPRVTYFSKSAPTDSSFIENVHAQTPSEPAPLNLMRKELAAGSADKEWSGSLDAAPRPALEDAFLWQDAPMDKTPVVPSGVFDKSAPANESSKIVIPMFTAGSVKPDDYPAYFNGIGGEIHDKAYELSKHVHRAKGEVRVKFTLRRDGRLLSAEINPAASVDNARLRRLALDIIRAAAPFDAFPSDMPREDLTVEVVLEFRLD